MDKITKAVQKLTPLELEFYRKHPELISAIGDKKVILKTILVATFIAGFLLVVVSKLLKFGLIEHANEVALELSVDLIFELGVALWGGVATTVLLQHFVDQKYKEGRKFQQEVMKILSETEGAE
jgi:hypothetical protein